MSLPKKSDLHGVLVVDKERGPTSHDVVGLTRRALSTREVGHTGTLDPMATGVLVVLVGEATKLSSYLGASDKRYEATLRLGVTTDTLDAEGETTETARVPELSVEHVEAVARTFLGESDQVAPLASAIKVSGQVLHRALRKGKDVVAPSRRVRLDEVRIHALRPAEIDLSLRCGKGFYVRALGRDLAHALGTVGHLTALRRTHNGSLAVDDAVATDTLRAARIDEDARRAVTAALMPLAEAVRGFTTVTLTDEGVLRARHGKTLRDVDVQERASGEGDVIIGRNAQGGLVALLRPHEEGLVVVRGFLPGV